MRTIIAHRGASSEAPENTLAAIRRAIDLKVSYVEIDVRLTQEGVPVVIHDAATRRTTCGGSPPEYIHKMTLPKLQALDFGGWFDQRFKGETIPSLKQVLDLPFDQTGLMVELKKTTSSPKKMVQAVLGDLSQAAVKEEKVIIGSFSPEIIQEVQVQKPAIRTIGIVEKLPMVSVFKQLNVKHLAIWHKLLTPSLIDELLKDGIAIWTFTVDCSPTADSLFSLGVKGVITNNPRLIAQGNF